MNKKCNSARRVLLTVATGTLLWLSLTVTASAQTATGGIRGVATDSAGAIIPNVSVTAKNAATGAEIRTTTNNDGFYSFARILPGSYNVSLETQGFKKVEFTNVDVSVGKDTVLDVQLQTGQISEVVTVTGGSEALVEKDSVQISATFQARKIQELPINVPGGGLDRIALLVPGVTPGIGANVNSNGTQISANGNRTRSNNFTIDGVDNNDLTIGGPNYFVQNPAVVAEIQVITNNFSAEYGRNQGAVVNYVSKSGTNDYHGSVFWDRLDNRNWNSRTNLEKRSGQKHPVYNVSSLLGYAVGGPLYLPRFGEGGPSWWNGKNRAFFFTSGFFRRNPGSVILRTTLLAPTPAGIQALKTAFPNNPAIQYYANYSAFNMPLGNPTIRPDVAQTTLTVGNVTVPLAAPQRSFARNNILDEYTLRGDGNVGDKHRLWGRFFRQKNPGLDQLAGSDGFTGDIPAFSRQIGGGWTWTASNRIVNEFRFNYSQLSVVFGGGGSGGPGNIPHPNQIDTALTRLNVQFTAGGRPMFGVGPATNLPQGRIVESYQYSDNLSLNFGNHQIKTGIDFRQLKNSAPFLPNVNGAFTYDTVQQLVDNTPSLLTVGLGPATLVYDEFDHFYYFQDDWRIRPNITLNLGVRYENTGQPMNLLNQITSQRESGSGSFWRQNLPLEARIIPKIPTDNNNIAPRLGFVYSPRFETGLLGRLLGRDKTTIRGGYGIAYDATFYNLMLNISTAAPTVFLTSVAGVGIPNAGVTGDKIRGAAIQSGLIRFNTFDPRFLVRTTPNIDFTSPYSQQWSFGLQREMLRDNVFEVRYVGTKGTGLFQTINANPLISTLANGFSRTYFDPTSNSNKTLTLPGFPQLLPSGARPLTCTDVAGTPDNEGACNGRLFPVGVVRERINGAQSIYHGLQTRFDSRLKNQITWGMTYTYSHTIDNSSEVFSFAGGNSVAVSQNPLNLTRGERGNSGFDIRHVFTANWLWDVPIMKDQKGFLGRLVGGWQFNGIVRIQTGVPFTPTHQSPLRNPYEDSTFLNSFFGQSALRPFNGNPNAVADRVAITDVDACIFYGRCGTTGGVPNLRTSSTGYYLLNDLNKSTPAFTSVSPSDVRYIINGPGAALKFGTPFGNVGRNSARGDRLESVDLSVFKNFRLTERFRMQYRLQLFNAFNHPFFGIPNSIVLDNAGSTFFNFQENDGGRRTISMGLSIQF